MKLSEIYKSTVPVLSFEVFPPKPEVPLENVMRLIGSLKQYSPSYISVTYGAGGSSRGRTIEIASRIKQEHGLEPVAHLTCVGQTCGEMDRILAELKENGVSNVLALRGDPPREQPEFDFLRGEFKYASELIEYIRSRGSFGIAAAAYPEGHRDSRYIDEDWENLKLKVDSGVDLLVTQLFYDNRLFYHFRDTVRKMGITVPIVPGVMPIFNSRQIRRILSLCGASMPPYVFMMLDKYGESDQDMYRAGVEYAIHQIQDLMSEGVDGIHLEVMNRPELAEDVLKGLSGAKGKFSA
jgi:methylenetetrahydrofolate reductase (NADPH)